MSKAELDSLLIVLTLDKHQDIDQWLTFSVISIFDVMFGNISLEVGFGAVKCIMLMEDQSAS